MQKIILISLIFLPFLLSNSFAFAASVSDFTPVAYWSLDESSGVRYDSTSNNNDLTDNNNVSSISALHNAGAHYNSANSQFLNISDSAQTGLDFTSSFSYSGWFKPTQLTEADQALFSKWGINTASYGLIYSVYNNPNAFYFFGYACETCGNINFVFPIDLNTNTWYFVSFVFDASSSTGYLYINGSLLNSFTDNSYTGSQNGSGPFSLGGLGVGIQWYPDAVFDEVGMYDYALSSSDVSILYNGGTPLPYAGGETPPDPISTTTPTSTPLSSDNGDVIFMLSVIVFFISTLWIGFVFNIFRNKK